MKGLLKTISSLAVTLLLLIPFTASAQKPYIDGEFLILPVVKVGDVNYRVELTINPATDPIQMTLLSADIEEDFSDFGAPELVGNVITIPKLRFETKNYELELTLVSENPPVFHVTSVREIAENFAATNLVTYSPEVCQSDIQLFRSETFQIQDQAEGYKGDFFGSRRIEVADSTSLRGALISLRFGTVLALSNTAAADLPGAKFNNPGTTFTVARDLGRENDPDYPVAFLTDIIFDDFTRKGALYRSDGKGGQSLVLLTGTDISLGAAGGEVNRFDEIRLSADGALFFMLTLKGDNTDYLVKQDRNGGPIVLLMASGEFLNTGSGDDVVRTIGEIEIESINLFDQVIAKVEVLDENGFFEGFAYLNTDNTTGSNQCLATDASILCGNGLVADDETLTSFNSDGTTSGIILNTPAGQVLDYKVIANPIDERLVRQVEFQGYSFNSFKKPLVCESRNALYFIGSFFESPIGGYDELFRIDEFNNLTKITDFKSLLLDPALEGQVPDEVVDWTIGYNCDVAFYMRGPSGPDSSNSYLGHWASYLTGETVEILDETPGRPNGNGAITSVQSSTSGIDATARLGTRTGPDGEFYFVPLIPDDTDTFLYTYAVATKPSCP